MDLWGPASLVPLPLFPTFGLEVIELDCECFRVIVADPVVLLGAIGVHGLVLGVVLDGVAAFDVVADFVIRHESGLARPLAFSARS